MTDLVVTPHPTLPQHRGRASVRVLLVYLTRILYWRALVWWRGW